MEPMNLMIQISKKTERLSFHKKRVNWIHAITIFWVHWSVITVHHIETVSLQFYNPLKHTTTFPFDLFLKFVDQNTSGLLFPLSLSVTWPLESICYCYLSVFLQYYTVTTATCSTSQQVMLCKTSGLTSPGPGFKKNSPGPWPSLPKQGKTGTPSIPNCRSFWQI